MSSRPPSSTSQRPHSARSTAWVGDDDGGFDNHGANFGEGDGYDQRSITHTSHHQEVEVREPESGCWFKFKKGIRCKYFKICLDNYWDDHSAKARQSRLFVEKQWVCPNQSLRKLKAVWPHPHKHSTHRQTPWTDNDSSLLFVAVGKARNLTLTLDLEAWCWPLTLTLTFHLDPDLWPWP